MKCQIISQDISIEKWTELLKKTKTSNLLQSPIYGLALQKTKGLKPHLGLILIDEKHAGLVHTQELSALCNSLQVITLDRGPLWFDCYGTQAHFNAFLSAFRRSYPKRLGRTVRFIPEMTSTPELEKAMTNHKFSKKAPGYQTIILNLQPDIKTLEKNLSKSWRGTLKKAQNSGVCIEWDFKGRQLPWLLNKYSLDKQAKNYHGPSPDLLRTMAKYAAPINQIWIGRAIHNKIPIAAIALFCHGSGTTYQIGWNSNESRTLGGNHLLLWEAVLKLKASGYKEFDLGGVNDQNAAGIKKFKSGMGGTEITLAGLYS